MLERRWHFFGWMGLALFCFGIDQISKALVLSTFRPNETLGLIQGFNLTLTFNTGASFSMLSDVGGWQRWLFSALALGFSCIAVFWIKAIAGRQLLAPAGLALILGGALGNLWDRLTLGHVVDFIQVYFREWYFPVFNLADSAITVGAGLLLLDAYRDYRAQRHQPTAPIS